jgi:hypothetical protein
MRKEAGIEELRKLYEVTTRIQHMKPWEYLWDMDLIGIQNGKEEDTVFYSILGRGGDCYGIAVYEGYEAYNKFLMMTMQEKLNLSAEYVMFNQKNLTCYWGNRDEISVKQRRIIKEMGYNYRGKNQWLYFLSFQPGYYPYELSMDEVLRMTGYMEDLELALKCYIESGITVNFEDEKMFSFVFEKDKTSWHFGEEPLPFTAFRFGNLIITDEELLSDLAKAPKGNISLELDVSPLGASIRDKQYERPANPTMCIMADVKTEMILRCEMMEPDSDPIAGLAEELIGFIFACGAPREIQVSNIIVESGLEQICELCKIKLRRVKRLKAIDFFRAGMKQFM